jgi:cell division septum initiation protein DivIVA
MTKKELMEQYDVLRKAVEALQPEMQRLRVENDRLRADLDAAARAEIADAQHAREEQLPGSDLNTTSVGALDAGSRPCAVCGRPISDAHGRFILPIGHVHQGCKPRVAPLPEEWSKVPVMTSVGASSDVPSAVSSSTSNTAIAVLVIGVGAALVFMSAREKKEKPWLR